MTFPFLAEEIGRLLVDQRAAREIGEDDVVLIHSVAQIEDALLQAKLRAQGADPGDRPAANASLVAA